MRRLTGLLVVTLVALSIPPYLLSQHSKKGKGNPPVTGTGDRAHQLASQALSQHPASCPTSGVTSLQECHTKFPDGCSASHHPTYDAYLDFLKDQDLSASAASTKDLAKGDLSTLESKLPKTLTAENHAKLASDFADLGEGNIYTVVAYLYFAVDTGKGTSSKGPNSETCNCKLTASGTFDYHLGIGFDPKLAVTAKSHPKDTDPTYTALEKDSVVAEMTPFIRLSHPKWTIDRVSALEGQQIKVVGQLMVDNVHFNANDDCSFTGATAGCWRSTVWEIHPITQFYVCKNPSGCSASSAAADWTNLDDMP